ncbi:xanthine dehydrogenase family protein molybdopterin-binding subunit [Haliangium ochraceum]|uniref:Aldehyde oxidase and xanthine dehydrogenase molybdopterin binding protein n=1 Tax=Haliangium ochraceum (strain DSM 14365 / JCM 11303 / SMP-2) TaxID=502025 RepID=D0LI71_HALO1|nr:xanthine dehydrogenase family protein molybdopterin-binding subunit [Haliangium ochraceum]ACY16450.1 aldehyde oxidase and xanthine dehydrogenase molybdopterin binding protein [Haliangium ochraceum DSM 14365]
MKLRDILAGAHRGGDSDSEQSWLRPSRRAFLKGTAAAGAGLVIGFQVGCGGKAQDPGTSPEQPGAGEDEFAPNAFLRIAPDDSVTVVSKHIEFGQGTYTGLATILAEELGADWNQVRVESAPADASRYANLAFGMQGTGGSNAMANSWQQLREAGATGRALLIAAASDTWGVSAADITVERGVVAHAGSGRMARFGELVDKAATMPLPAKVVLKDPENFTLIGTDVPRVDVAGKTNGAAQFTLDVYLPGMLTALVARPPRFGAKPARVDASAAEAMPGVVQVVEIASGIAVVAKNFWAAKKGRDALAIEWNEDAAETRSSDEMQEALRQMLEQDGIVAKQEGDMAAALASAARVVEAEFEFPYLAHAPMETMDCVAKFEDGRCEMWFGSQIQTTDQMGAAQVLGIQPQNVIIHTLLAGGSFGRRGTFDGAIAVECASLLKATGSTAPIKLVWTREDDIRGGFYRPIFRHRMRGAIDAQGKVAGWEHRLAGPSIMLATPAGSQMVQNGVDPTSVEGAAPPDYQLDNLYVDVRNAEFGPNPHFWRSVGSTHTAFAVEVFIDMLAEAMGQDPVDLRRTLLGDKQRHLAVLDLVVEKSGWGSAMPRGKARGIAIHESFGSVVAEVAEVSLAEDGMPKVERVVCAVDCGVAINPDNVRAQVEGGLGYGLGAALYNEITLEGGRVVQSNFDQYRPLRIQDMPTVEVHIVPSGNAPSGIGEPGLPPIAPAVANAYFRLTGKRITSLPFARAITKQRRG